MESVALVDVPSSSSKNSSTVLPAKAKKLEKSLFESQTYGSSTAAAVLTFNRERGIINRAYQTQADNIVGKMTMAALDAEVLLHELRGPLPKGDERPPQFT